MKASSTRSLHPLHLLVIAAGAGLLGACDVPTLELLDLATDGNSCSVDADCCVVVDECRAEAFIVTEDEFEQAKNLKQARSDDGCANCTVPVVAVECLLGVCVGKAFDPLRVSYDADQALDSCGPRELDTDDTNVEFAAVEDGFAICGDEPDSTD